MESVQHLCPTHSSFSFKGATRLSACVRWTAPPWTATMRWLCRLKLLSLQQNKCWRKGNGLHRWHSNSNIFSEDLASRAWQWSYSLTALFSYAFVFGQIFISISVTVIFFYRDFLSRCFSKVAGSVKKKRSPSLEALVLLLYKFGRETLHFCLLHTNLGSLGSFHAVVPWPKYASFTSICIFLFSPLTVNL